MATASGRGQPPDMAYSAIGMEAHAAFDDARLVFAVQRGDAAAEEEIVRRHRPDVYRTALRALGAPADAEDVTQQTMIRALAALRRRPPLDLRGWLLAIARNETRTLMASRRPVVELDETLTVVSPGADPVEVREEARRLLEDIAALPRRQREALVARELLDLPYPEIARRLGATQGATRQAVMQARESLRARALGRERPCGEVLALLAGPDRRRARSTVVRAHLDVCERCRAEAAVRRAAAFIPLGWLTALAARLAPAPLAPLAPVAAPGAVAVAIALSAGALPWGPGHDAGGLDGSPGAAAVASVPARSAGGIFEPAASRPSAALRPASRRAGIRPRPAAPPSAGGLAAPPAPPSAATPTSASAPSHRGPSSSHGTGPPAAPQPNTQTYGVGPVKVESQDGSRPSSQTQVGPEEIAVGTEPTGPLVCISGDGTCEGGGDGG